MGIVRMGPPEELVLLIKSNAKVSTFIETGTYQGDTTIWAAKHFEKVVTIERSRALFELVSEKYEHVENAKFLFGDSRSILGVILSEIREPAILWLDAHWCSGDSYGEHDQCPIIEEIGAIVATGMDHSILIDDARLFLSPPPLPNLIEQWPSIDQITRALQAGGASYYITVFEDVVIAVPIKIKAVVAGYLQEQNTRAWQERGIALSKKEASMPNVRLVIRKIRNKLCVG